jgi:LytS/YehU family sensor histidine kinase
VRSSVTGNFDHASEDSYSFIISKPFWKQWWFVILCILSVTGFLVYVIKEREKAAKKWQQLQTEKLKSQYETLKNQVNPHFLFNSFNTLLGVIEEDPKKASEYVEHLSDFYRSIVNMREKDLISLGEELTIITGYFFIQKKRFGSALLFDSRITDEQKKIYSIPPLSLQLLAENAVKHNIVSKDKPLTLELFVEGDMLVVRNNINEKTTREKSEGLGLQNIKNRFLLIADKEVKIEITSSHFIIKLPLIKRL